MAVRVYTEFFIHRLFTVCLNQYKDFLQAPKGQCPVDCRMQGIFV